MSGMSYEYEKELKERSEKAMSDLMAEKTGTPRPSIDLCEHGHAFLARPDHPRRDGLRRCPYCLASGWDLLRERLDLSERRCADLAHDVTRLIATSTSLATENAELQKRIEELATLLAEVVADLGVRAALRGSKDSGGTLVLDISRGILQRIDSQLQKRIEEVEGEK